MADHGWSDGLLEGGFGDPEVAGLVGWPARVERMVEVEGALGLALASAEVIPQEAGTAIANACRHIRIDPQELADRAASAPTPVIALVAMLREAAVDEGAAAEEAAADDQVTGAEPVATWLHHGATSQDVVDTATLLQVRDALRVVARHLVALGDRCAVLAADHRASVMVGRTLGQPAVPITFGLKAARWLGAIDRRLEALRWSAERALAVQLGGAAGTLAVYGERGPAVVRALADELDLAVPDLPWHAERDRVVELAGVLQGIVTVVADVAGDLVLHAQSEIGELREAAGDGLSSSAMPHKRNPTHATAARAASRLALGELGVLVDAAGDHGFERAAGAWQAEWVALPSALVRTAGAVSRLVRAVDGLEVDVARARRNLDAQHGLTASEALASGLAPRLGRARARSLVAELAASVEPGHDLRQRAAEHPEVAEVLTERELDELVDPAVAVAHTGAAIDQVLATHERVRSQPGLA